MIQHFMKQIIIKRTIIIYQFNYFKLAMFVMTAE